MSLTHVKVALTDVKEDFLHLSITRTHLILLFRSQKANLVLITKEI